jgi:PAS domain S-box-containing protein
MDSSDSPNLTSLAADPERLADVYRDLPVAYTEVNAQGIVRVANEAACRLHAMTREELIGHAVWEFVPGDEALRDRMEFFQILNSGEELEPIRRTLYTSRGGYRFHELHRRVLRDADGAPRGLCSVTFDITDLEAAHREAVQAKLRLESAMAAISQAVVVTDALGFVRYINPAAERLTNWHSEELMGQQFEKGMPILRAVSKTGKPLSFRMTLLEPWHGDVELMTRERQTVAVWLSASPIVDQETGYINGVVIVLGAPKVVAAAP